MPHPLSRRALLASAAAAGALGAFGAPAASAAAPSGSPSDPDPFAPLLARARTLLTGGDIDPGDPAFAAALHTLDAAAAPLWSSLDRSAGRSLLWPDLSPVTDPGMFGQSATRLRTLATAWATAGASLSGDAELAAALVSALRFLHDAAYHEGARESGNWWFWEIGTPRALLDCCVLLGDRVPAADLAAYLETVRAFVPDPDRRTNSPGLAETGANRSDKSVITALSGLLGRDADRVALARDGLSDVRDGGRYSLFQYADSGDGFYADGSFVQHDCVAYTGSYGTVLLGGAAYLLALLDGSPWEVTDPGVTVLYDAVERSFGPVVFEGLMMDAVRGRAISRQAAPDHVDGAAAVSAVLLLAQSAPDRYASRWRALVKGWLTRNRAYPYQDSADVPGVARAVALLADEGVTAAPSPTGHHVLADMDRVVHRRERWACSLALSSRRIAAYEAGNGENLHGWYTGAGMVYVHTADDPGQFGDGFWPTVDPYRLPGTTVLTGHRDDLGTTAGTGVHLPPNAVAGGADLQGRFGAAAMELAEDGNTLRARKTWFFTDDAVVALGSGITAHDRRSVETVVDNRRTADARARLLVDGLDRAAPAHRARWAHLEGFGGYVFPGGAALHTARERRTGTWRAIDTGADTGGDDTPVTRDYATLWLDHGSDPADAGYAYVLLPGAGAARAAAWSLAPPVRVLARGPEAHAVSVPRVGLFAAHFWAAGAVGGVACDGPGTVLVRRRGHRVSVAVADPGRTARTLTVTLPIAARGVREADGTVRVSLGPRTTLAVRVAGSRGHTHRAELV